MATAWAALDVAALRAALLGEFFADVRVLDVCGSTNAEVLAAAARGAPEGLLVVAERQTAGRGRLGRSWQAPARAGLTFSLLVRPDAPPSRVGLLPLVAGIALCTQIRQVSGLPVAVKWPNDLIHPPTGGKLAGVLCEAAGGAVVVGVGLNVHGRVEDLPVPTATSLAALGVPALDRTVLLIGLARRLASHYAAWRAGADVLAEFRRLCVTLGQQVRVRLTADELTGTAVDVDAAGRLVVVDAAGVRHAVAAGDAEHVRPAALPR